MKFLLPVTQHQFLILSQTLYLPNNMVPLLNGQNSKAKDLGWCTLKIVCKNYEQALNIVHAGLLLNGYTFKAYPNKAKKIICCFNCQKLGHIARNCSFPTRCPRCSSTDHGENFSKNPSLCANCGGSHPATSSDCSLFKSIAQKVYARNTKRNEHPSV